MARDKVLYDGHAVAAVAATSPAIAEEACELIEVSYHVLPHVIDVEDAMKPDAPILHDDLFTQGVEPKPTHPSNVAKMIGFTKGDLEAGFREADVTIERRYTNAPVHQAYIEPHACVVSVGADGQTTIWSSSQGQFMVRAYCAKLLGIDISQIRAIPAEIGGGFGGKTLIYLEPLALAMSRKTGRPVKMVMSREEVFRGTGPAAGAVIEVRLGAKKDGTLTAAEAVLKYQAGAFPGSPVGPGCMCAFAMYDIPNAKVTGYDVVSNRPKVAAYRAPGAPNSSYGVESCLDELADQLGIDPLALREKNAAKDGVKALHGPTWQNIGYSATVDAAKNHPHMKVPLGPNQGRGIASGFWFNIGGESSAACHINEDGTAVVVSGNPDVGGSRASLAMMAAEVLGIPVEKVRPIVGDTSSIGYSFLTGGSRVTFATGMAATQAAEKVVDELKKRAAMIWDISPDAVEWKDGKAFPAGPNAGSFDPLPLAEIALKSGRTGGPISAEISINAQGAGPGFATHICDVEVDKETGYVKILRYTAVQDVGRAIHPSYVEGQIQGGVTQGIGWALERGIHLRQGRAPRKPGLSRLPRAGRPRCADDRHRDGREREPAAPVWRARCRRGADRAADGGGRQRDQRRDRCAHARSADVAAPAARRDRRAGTAARGGVAMPRVHFLGPGRPPVHRRADRARCGGQHFPPHGSRARPPLPRPRPPDRGKHGGGDRRRDLSGRLPGSAQTRERDRPDPQDRRRLIGWAGINPLSDRGIRLRTDLRRRVLRGRFMPSRGA